MGRADRLFSAKQYGAARTAYTALQSSARGDDRELVDLRIAESNYFLKRARDARDGLRPYLKGASRQAEALYFHALSIRDLGDRAGYLTTIRRIVDDFPRQSWAEEALDNLATHYIVRDEDDRADETFRELYAKYPRGPRAERAAWKVGWRAYLKGQHSDTVKFFERAASDFPRSDYRPAWLYWSGRSHEELKERELAHERYTLATADYVNSYYGRLAVKRLGGRHPAPRVITESSSNPPAAVPPNAPLVQALIAAGLYADAINELRYAQRTSGDSPAIQATIAWILHEQGLAETGPPRFAALRGAITTMRRAYPQFLAAGGELLPREILEVIFPLEYWDLIRKYAAVHDLDPYLMAALISQESTFAPDVRSVANAVGLMQLLPSTARQQARKLKMTYSARLLTDPDANLRLGTAYFAEKMKEFGALHLALASYNAGESAVRQWIVERRGLSAEEFIDDIPYPETQNYVKRILGTAEDYKRLYKP
jgi:soluble lytic murein transglycosylase